jgi:hypothetical protein
MNNKSFLAGAAASIAVLFSGAALAANVGYYDMDEGQGNPEQVAPITAAGHTPVDIVDLSPAELAGIDVLFVQNPDNDAFGAEYLGALADIESAVNSGMRLVIHDRFVTDAESILPAGAGFDIVRDFTDDANIDILDSSTLVTNGPGGVLDDTSLDGGNSSSHGFAVVGTLPAGGAFILTRSDMEEIVTFSYPFGSGAVLYSSIPLDFYLGGSGSNPPRDNFTNIYAVNVIAYAVEGMMGITDVAYFKVTKTFSDGSTDEVDVMLTCNTGLPLKQDFTIAGGDPDGVTFVVTDFVEETMDCEVTETGTPAGYTTVLNGGAGCEWEDVTSGFRVCQITNEANPATYTVYKDWTVYREGGDVVVGEADVTIECDSAIVGGDEDDGSWTLSGTLSDGETLVATVDTTEGPATCSASEEITQSGVEQASVGCDETSLAAGGSHTCTFTNTVFFEGIPTLSQYGLAILVLLTLGVGFIGFRRFA